MDRLTEYRLDYVVVKIDGDEYLVTVPSLFAWNNLVTAHERGTIRLPKQFFRAGTEYAACFLKQNTEDTGSVLLSQPGKMSPKLVAAYQLMGDAYIHALDLTKRKQTRVSQIQEVSAFGTHGLFRPCLVPLCEQGFDSMAFVDTPNGTIVEGGTYRKCSPLTDIWYYVDPDETTTPYVREYDPRTGRFFDTDLQQKAWKWVVWDGMLISTRCVFRTSVQALWESKLAYPAPKN